ncbi:MAG: hypothetical protein A2632_00535 [Candidatus Pacebacteria bacterium RIFCSPHIGHO2_01_FULL_46_16]|nr:MAG: hypothetical protein A2632_00535 [Candidatus Pacebacteria bacterium RIFCSPHIGHO2_01_FULL_46_16]OGJ38715.1 MAG: hypothetical protein A3A82_03230 [Candidatus Pacebacteria bacterium RIFCSPLOWO2_01_FULL_47_12]
MKTPASISPTKYRAVAGALVLVFTLLSVRLTDLQLLRGQEFFDRSEDNKSFQAIIARRRGVILDRYQEPLAFNAPTYFLRDAKKLFAPSTRVTPELALAVAAAASEETEVVIGMERTYPFAAALGHAVGYTGAVSVDNLRADTALLPSDTIGKFGLERSFEMLLRGVTGATHYTVDARGNRLAIDQQLPGKSGETLATSLDPYLASVAAKLMAELRGSVIISDPKTGQILTLLSSPSFDPNLLTKTALDRDAERQRQEQVRLAISHPQQLFFNRAIAGAYPPGSVFKLITAIAGIETNAITAATTVEDTGVLTVNDFSYANWYYSQYGRTDGVLSLQRALARSNDIFFYKTAEVIGPDRLAEFARLFGFGTQTKLELGGEVTGLVPDPQWKERTLGERWFLGNTYHFGIGQGLLLVTPLQVAQMTTSIANKGTHCPTTLLRAPQQCEGLGIADTTLELVVSGMLDVCSFGGTAYPLFAYNEKRRPSGVGAYEAVRLGAIACKTGTAEFGSNNAQGSKQTHAWFTAMVGTKHILEALENASSSAALLPTTPEEADATQLSTWHEAWRTQVKAHGLPETLAITVLIESDETKPFREGSADAAPIVVKLLEWMEGG